MNDQICENKYRSWNEFKTIIFAEFYNDSIFVNNRHLFRGQSNPEWSLVSTFDRIFEDKRIANQLLFEFKKECEKYDLVNKELLTNDSSILALGQHHGLPTRLLDWTESPYVAAFFAFTNAKNQNDIKEYVTVWILNNNEVIWSQDNGIKIIDVPSMGNIRLRNQSGKFTLLSSPHNNLEDHIADLEYSEITEPILVKCLIPSSDIKVALADLRAMGIDYYKLFPDIQGIALNTKMKILYNL